MATTYRIPKVEDDKYLIIVREGHERQDERYIRDTFNDIPTKTRVVLAQTAEGSLQVDDKVIFGTFTVEQGGRSRCPFALLTDYEGNPTGIARHTVVSWHDVWMPDNKKRNEDN